MARTSDDPRTYGIIGAAMEVHNELGPGYLEVAYQRALAREFAERSIPFEREAEVPLYYKGEPLGVPFRVDFLCWGDVMVEIKALPATGRTERRQLAHYLRGGHCPTGLLLNFGEESLHVERVDWTPCRAKEQFPSLPSPQSQDAPAGIGG